MKVQYSKISQEQTYESLYEQDVALIRSEKEALLRYMRESVKENGDFLIRIRELEDDKCEMLSENESYLEQIDTLRGQIQELQAEIVTL